MKAKRVRVETAPNGRGQWKVTRDSKTVFTHKTKIEANQAARLLVDTILLEGLTVTWLIKRRDGVICKNGERTYPRSSDPRRSKG